MSMALVSAVGRADVLPPPDECLRAIGVPEGRPVVLGVLSPRMVYSVTEWPRMRAAAEAAGFVVVAWRSPLVPEAEWRSAVQQAGWTRDVSEQVPVACLTWLGKPNHYPYTRVVVQERIHPWPVWGVLPDRAWVESLRCRRDALTAVGQSCAP